MSFTTPGLHGAYRRADLLEYDGHAVHAGREEEDAAREDDLRRRGWIVVRAKAADLIDPTRIIAELRAAFAQRGYSW